MANFNKSFLSIVLNSLSGRHYFRVSRVIAVMSKSDVNFNCRNLMCVCVRERDQMGMVTLFEQANGHGLLLLEIFSPS